MDNNDDEHNVKRSTDRKLVAVWFIILGMYILVLVGIGQVAFTKQYFNEADSMVGDFLQIKEKYGIDDSETDTTQLINALIENSANASSDLQELASQSFNIVLGALLAFLSASATMVFQAIDDNKFRLGPSGKKGDKPRAEKEKALDNKQEKQQEKLENNPESS